MDALVLNKVEAEFLKISNEISKIFECQIIIESYATEEGGIKSTYKFLTNRDNIKYTLATGVFVTTIIGNILTNVISEYLNSDAEQEKLTKEKTILEIEHLKDQKKQSTIDYEKAQLEIQSLKQNITKDSIEISKNLTKDQEETELKVDQKILDQRLSKVIGSKKIKNFKSNFYKNLAKDKKVEKVSTVILNNEGEQISKERFVSRENFRYFIYKEETLEPKYIDNIELEIVSPVLKNNKISWRALYEGVNISFSVKDKNFQNLILNKGLSFSNGTKLLCDLEIRLKASLDGEIKETTKTVYNVRQIKYSNGDIVDV
ncbi:MAG TPA: hypothetical protein VGB50_06600 [Flavobacterium sp.]